MVGRTRSYLGGGRPAERVHGKFVPECPHLDVVYGGVECFHLPPALYSTFRRWHKHATARSRLLGPLGSLLTRGLLVDLGI